MFRLGDGPLDIELLVVPDATLILVAAVIEPLRAANRLLGRDLYAWTISTPDGRPVTTTAGLPVPADRTFDPAASDAPLFILASYNEPDHADRGLIRRIGAAARRRSHLVGVESGAWLMARAGLLNGRKAAVHWEDRDAFATAYPETDVRPDRFIVDGNRITTGGASPALDLMLELIGARQGFATALQVSRLFIYDQARLPDEPQQSAAFGRLTRRDGRVAEAVRVMEETVEDPIPISMIAQRVGITARHLQTLFADVLNISPKAYYLALRLNQGRRLMLETRLPVLEVAGRCGFHAAGTFGRAYRQHFGESPIATRRLRRQARRGGAN